MARTSWRLRQFSPVDDTGRVVDTTLKRSVADQRVVGWRVRWDTPTGLPKSKSFSKSKYATATAALDAARDLVAMLEVARQKNWAVGADGLPVDPDATTPPPSAGNDATTMGVVDLAREWLVVKGGAAGSQTQREGAIHFMERC